MIGRKNRFHGHNSLNYLFRHGRTVRVELISLRFAPSKRDDYRLAVIVSKKVSKSAVVRNRIRRRIYEIVRLIRKDSKTNWKVDMSLTIFDERVASMPHAELAASVDKLLKKAGII